MIEKQSGELVGQCGLTMQPYREREVVEVGYLLVKRFWRRGYATEAAVACREYAFERLKIPEVYSIIRENNFASQRVAKRNGMTERDRIVKHYYGMDMPHLVFSVRREGR